MNIEAPNLILLNAAVFYCDALQITKLEGSVDILYAEGPDDGMSGWIEYANGHADIYVRRNYTDPTENVFEILAHEMVHLKQYITGELVDIPGRNEVYWKGQVMMTTNNPDLWTYWESPWELEAFGRQQGLNYKRQLENLHANL
jgi:hypothetical protein